LEGNRDTRFFYMNAPRIDHVWAIIPLQSKGVSLKLGYKGKIHLDVWCVPQDVKDQHGVAYDPEWIAKCNDQSN